MVMQLPSKPKGALGTQSPPELSSTVPPALSSTKASAGRPDNTAVALVVDSETTGLDPNTDELIELALVQFWFDQESFDVVGIAEKYSGLRQPSRPIPPEATRIHGLTDKDVRNASLDGGAVRSLILGSDLLISHNATFDRPFVERLFPEAGHKTWLCSLRGIDWSALGHRSASLQALCADFGLDPGTSHRALDDALVVLNLLRKSVAGGAPLLKVLIQGPAASGVPHGVSRPHITDATRRQLAQGLAELETTTDLVSRHFLFLNVVSTAYQVRKVDQEHRTLCENFARRHLEEFEKIAPALKQRFNDELPYVPTFDQLTSAA